MSWWQYSPPSAQNICLQAKHSFSSVPRSGPQCTSHKFMIVPSCFFTQYLLLWRYLKPCFTIVSSTLSFLRIIIMTGVLCFSILQHWNPWCWRTVVPPLLLSLGGSHETVKAEEGRSESIYRGELLYKEAEYSLFTGGSPKVLQAFELHIVFCWLIFFFLHLLPWTWILSLFKLRVKKKL